MISLRTLAFAAALAAAPTLAAAQIDVLSLGTNPQGSLQFNAGAAIAKVIDDKMKQQIRVQPMAGTSTYMPLINRNEVNIGIANVLDSLTSYQGTDTFAGKPNPNLRLIARIFPLPLAFMVPADSPVKKIADLKGMRLASGYAGQTTGAVVQEALLANGGISSADARPVPVVNLFQAAEMMGQGRLDASAIGPGGTAQVQKAHADLASRGGIRFISIDTGAEAVARMNKIIPSRPLRVDPAPHNVGVLEPIHVMAYSMFLVGNNALPDDLSYRIAKTLHESKADLLKVTPVLERFDPGTMTEKIDMPWHPGAIRFYTEIGQWPPKE
ncbi:MAG: TAXI family TRAP transporter solute-binding subunit [Alphaproteobacteria bacterium]|nr:TAXI family TRAP transporter solute-binding subunit [Alphaproteobacteria bacterium]